MSIPPQAPVSFFDWRALYAERAPDYARILTETAAEGRFILQAEVAAFEHALGAYLGGMHVVGVSDCTHAMLLGLRADGLAPGDEVILPGHGFIAAAQAIHHAGARPVPVDLSEQDGLIDPKAIAEAISPRTHAIMAVHVNGRVCDMDPILDLADRHGLTVYEDAAQALGASSQGQMAGSFGRWGAFSFYPSKTLGCFGDAGAIVTRDAALADRLRAMRNHGAGPDKTISPDCAEWGTNSRLDNIHAAILTYKLAWYETTLDRRRAIARRYHAAFAPLGWLDLPVAPDAEPDRRDIFQNYEVRCDRRDALRAHLAATGIDTIVQWGGTPLHHFTALGMARDLPRTDRYFRQCLLLPMNHLLADDAVDRVIDAVTRFVP